MSRKRSDSAVTSCRTPKVSIETRLPLAARPLLESVDAEKVMALFKVLSNDTRIRILHHIIRSGEATVSDIARSLEMKPQAISNQLIRLSDTRMLTSRREGNNVFYRVENCCVAPLLDLALCLMESGSKPLNDQGTNDVEPD